MSLATLTVELQGNVSKLESDMAEMRNVVQMYMERIGVAANDASKHIEGVAQAGRQVQRSRGVDEAVEGMNHLNFSTVGARRELLVLAHELSQGNFKRAAGSVM
ncbi:MAG: phage tail tape measure protein, partial [Ralstonia sp.]|nr:phage tail tape measure protein [Ralstonia sp.]